MNQLLNEIWKSHQPLVEEVAKTIGDFAELSMEEYRSAAYLCDTLQSLDFKIM